MKNAKVCLHHRLIVLVFEEACGIEKWVSSKNCDFGEKGTGK
jgi:hypothetical protein